MKKIIDEQQKRLDWKAKEIKNLASVKKKISLFQEKVLVKELK